MSGATGKTKLSMWQKTVDATSLAAERLTASADNIGAVEHAGARVSAEFNFLGCHLS